MKSDFPIQELRLWVPTDKQSTQDVLQWLQSVPRKDLVGWIQIGDNPPKQITYRNRHTWERILLDFTNILQAQR